ncbi:MAG: hypothetical protein NTW19_21410 [Planctomycetota bacterium]|nr:hypothetical protein [Planctomycetota bacterium]
MRLSLGLLFATAVLGASQAFASTISLKSIDAQAATVDGVHYNLVSLAVPTVLPVTVGKNNLVETRGLLEFCLTDIPADAVINSVTLKINVDLALPLALPLLPPPPQGKIIFDGFSGNGICDAADANPSSNQLGITGFIGSPGSITTVLSTAYIQSLLGNSTHLGIVAREGVNNTSQTFDSTETAALLGALLGCGPVLTIDYTAPQATAVPVPAAGFTGLAGLALVGLASLKRKYAKSARA